MSASLGLGTVQFGLPYGVANGGFVPSDEEIGSMLDVARATGITSLDTAAQYGDSEKRLGGHDLTKFDIVSKTPDLDGLSPPAARAAILDGAQKSLAHLGVSRLKALLVHRAADLLGPAGEAIYRALTDLRSSGAVHSIGVSVYDELEIDRIMSRFQVDVMQVPVNAIDHRLVDSGRIADLAARGIGVHARSVFLQGLLLMREPPPSMIVHRPVLDNWRRVTAAQGLDVLEAALAFVRDLNGVSIVFVGAASAEQLTSIADAFRQEKRFDASDVASNDHGLLDPRTWIQ